MKKILVAILVLMLVSYFGDSAAHADNGEALEAALEEEYFVKVSDDLWIYENEVDYNGLHFTVDGTFYPEKDYGMVYITRECSGVTWQYFARMTWNGNKLSVGHINEIE